MRKADWSKKRFEREKKYLIDALFPKKIKKHEKKTFFEKKSFMGEFLQNLVVQFFSMHIVLCILTINIKVNHKILQKSAT